MNYLLYLRDGAIRKFPLQKRDIYLGRSPECDFYLDEDFISKRHACITCIDNTIKITDLDSKNGTYVENLRIKEARIGLNESFRIGYLVFYLKKGDPQEILPKKEAKPLINKISDLISVSHKETDTSLNLFDKALITILRLGFCLNCIDDLLQWAKTSLTNTLKNGQLLLISKEKNEIKTLSRLNIDNTSGENDQLIINLQESNYDLFTHENLNQKNRMGSTFYSFPLRLSQRRGVLVYITQKRKNEINKIIQFLRDFASEVSLIYQLIEKDRLYRQDNKDSDSGIEIISRDEVMLNLLERCKKIAVSDLFALLEGETGTGKELVARFIHHHSRRNREKYIGINCSAIPHSLLEEELFGHEKGAFTGANQARKGKLESASGGTLVLDEIGDMPIELQTKLLRVLQEKEFYPLGSNRKVKVDVRIISLTHRDLAKLISKNKFREDLYYRLAQVNLKIPPLRQRPGDIQPLIDFFFEKFS